jgi:hypothetical protein
MLTSYCHAAASWLQDVSSGEELDELGELGSSDNEQERFLQVGGWGGRGSKCLRLRGWVRATGGGSCMWVMNH